MSPFVEFQEGLRGKPPRLNRHRPISDLASEGTLCRTHRILPKTQLQLPILLTLLVR
jgi:hypothetical protein